MHYQINYAPQYYEIVVNIFDEQRAHISSSTKSGERRNIYRCNCYIKYSFHFSDTLWHAHNLWIQHSCCNAPLGGSFVGPFSSALDTVSCLVLHSFGSIGVFPVVTPFRCPNGIRIVLVLCSFRSTVFINVILISLSFSRPHGFNISIVAVANRGLLFLRISLVAVANRGLLFLRICYK